MTRRFIYVVSRYEPAAEGFFNRIAFESFDGAKQYVRSQMGHFASLSKYANRDTYHLDKIEILP